MVQGLQGTVGAWSDFILVAIVLGLCYHVPNLWNKSPQADYQPWHPPSSIILGQAVSGAPSPTWLKGRGSTLLLETFQGFGVMGTNITLWLPPCNTSHAASSQSAAALLPFVIHPPAVQLPTEALLAARSPDPQAVTSAKTSKHSSSVLAVALAIPLSVMGALLLAGGAWLLARRHRMATQRPQLEQINSGSSRDKFDAQAPWGLYQRGGLVRNICFV